MRLCAFFLIAFPFSALAQISNVVVDGVTSVQAILRYTAPSQDPCAVEVSENSSLSPLVHDVDPILFPGSQFDEGGTLTRVFVIGKRTVERAANGKAYSRALQTATVHHYRITCGAAHATGTFVTAIAPFGITTSPGVDVENGAPLFPTIDRADFSQHFIDPNTGVLFRKGAPLTTGQYPFSRSATGCEKGAGWNNLCAITVEDGTSISYSGSTQDPVDARFHITSFGELNDPVYHFQLLLKAHSSAPGERLRACRINRYTDDCDGPIYESADLPTSPGTVLIPPDPPTASVWQSQPTAIRFTATGKGRVWNSGPSPTIYFTVRGDCEMLREGETIRSGGTVASNALSLTSATVLTKHCSHTPPAITVTSNVNWSGAGTGCPENIDDAFCGYPFYFSNGMVDNPGFRIRIWRVGTTPGATIHIDVARLQMLRATFVGNTAAGFHRPCSALEDTNGFVLCGFNSRLIAVRKSDGEVRYLGGMYIYLSALNRGSGYVICGFTGGSVLWSHQDPRTLYCSVRDANTQQEFLYRVTYTGTYDNVSQTWDGILPGPSAFKPSDFTLLSPVDTKTAIKHFADMHPTVFTPPFDPNDWHCGPVAVGGTNDDIFITCKLDSHGGGLSAQQDSMNLLAVFRSGHGVVAANPSYASPACRWCMNHSIDASGPKPVFPMQFQTPKEEGDYPGRGQWQVKAVTSIPACTVRNSCAPCPPNSLDNILGYGLVTTAGTLVTGYDTLFRHWLDVGATITISGQTRVIASVPSNTSVVVTEPFSPDVTKKVNWFYSIAGQRRCTIVRFETDSLYKDWAPGSGTVSVQAGSVIVTGVSTSFRTTLRYKDKLRINGEIRTISHIDNNGSLRVDAPFNQSASDVTWEWRYPDKPAGYVDGNFPISKNYPRFLLRLEEGDLLQRRLGAGSFGETLRLIKDLGNGEWVVQRAAGIEGTASGNTATHDAGAIFFTTCSVAKNVTAGVDREPGLRWFYDLDNVGTSLDNTVIQRIIAGHAVEGAVTATDGHAINGKYALSHFDPSTPESYRLRQMGDVMASAEPVFAGKTGPCSGLFCENHPSYVPDGLDGMWARTFFDHNPVIGGGTKTLLSTILASSMSESDLTFTVASSGNFSAVGPGLVRIDDELVIICSRSGTVFTVCPGGRGFEGTTVVAHAAGSPVQASMGMHLGGSLFLYQAGAFDRPLHRKHFHTFALSGNRMLSDISGPNSFITKTNANAFQYCVAEAPGECRPGSQKGMLFSNVPLVEPAFTFCSGGELPSGANDLCFFNWGQFANVVSQLVLPVGFSQDSFRDNTGSLVRRLGHLFTWPRRISSVANVKPVAGQRWLFAWFNLEDHTWNMLIKVPPFRPGDSISRNTFVPLEVTVSQAPSGTASAVVEFGYDKQFRCTSRNEKCVAFKTQIDENDPFRWPAEGGITGVSCDNGCKIVVPAISNRIVYYQTVYLNASGAEVGRGPRLVTAIP